MKKKILIIITSLVAVIGVFSAIYFPNSNLNNTLQEAENVLIEEIRNEENNNSTIIISDETQESAEETIEATENGEDVSTKEIIESSEEEEKNITDEGALETDAVVEQENISYDGTNTGNGLSLLGSYQGLTYYSQADSRWANVMYSSIGDRSQTMKSSACGPTSAAIVVSSSKGSILPTTMASLAVSNGYRTSNNGTAWAYFPFVADYFDFNEFYTTSNFDTAMSYLRTDADNDGNSDYYIVCSCASGLFTTGGHYIALVDDNGGTITVYDPYLYAGKFTTASRRNAGVVVSGNSAYVSENSFRNYANYRYFWIFSNDKGSGNENKNAGNATVNYTRYVATQSSNLNVRSSAGGTIITSLAKGTAVNVVETNGVWSRITSPVSGWVSNAYLSSSAVSNTTSNNNNYNVKVTARSGLNIRSGAGTGYKILGGYKYGTTVTITQTNGNWGKTNKGWICLTYTTGATTTSATTNNTSNGYSLGLYQVNTRSGLNVRTGAGTNYKIKRVYSNGTRFDTYEIKGDWARTPSGWVNLNYCKLIRKY